MRRWTLRVSLAVLGLLVVGAVTVQAVLMTDVPKRIVLGQLQKQLGLKVSAATLRTGWGGTTNLSNVTLALPLAGESFLDVPKMTVRHTSLPMLLLTRSVVIDALELDRPNLAVQRDEAGKWNVADVAELIGRAGGKQNETATGTPKLPAVTITQGTVVVDDATLGQRRTIPDLNVTGRRDGPLVYRYDVKVSDRVSLVGQVAPGAPWKHEVDAQLADFAEWLKPWVQELPADAAISAQWAGQLDGDGRVQGRLELVRARAGAVAAKGAVAIRHNGDGSFTAEPVGITVTTGQAALPEVQLASGRLTADGKGVRAERLLVTGVGGQARVDGNFALLTRSGELSAEWTDLLVPQLGIKNLTGSLKAEVGSPFPDRPQLKAKLVASGTTPDGPFAATLGVDGSGRSGWGEMDWRLFAENLDWNGNYPLSFDGSVIRVETTHRRESGPAIVRLLGVEKPGEPVVAGGEIDLSTGKWKAWLNAGAIALPKSDKQMSLALDAWGNRDHVRLEQFYVGLPRVECWAQGWYVYANPKPVELDAMIRTREGAAETVGTFRSDVHLSGTAAAPRDLEVTGKVRASGLRVAGKLIDEVKADIGGHIDNQQAAIVTEQLELLKGKWNVDALYDAKTRGMTVGIKVADLPADAIATALGQKNAAGVVSGQWTVYWPSVVGGIETLGMNGSLVATGVKAGAFIADRVDARTSLDRGTFYVNDVRATRRVTREVAGNAEPVDSQGRIDASAKVALAKPSVFTVMFQAHQYPVRVDGVWADVTGGTEMMTVDVNAPLDGLATNALTSFPRTLAARGKVTLDAKLMAGHGTEVAQAKFDAALNGRELDVKGFRVETSGGVIEGKGQVDADFPLDSTFGMTFNAIDSVMLADLFPAAVGLGGTYHGSLKVGPAKDPRALAPLKFSLEIRPTDGRYRDVEFGNMRLNGYTNLDRLVLADLSDSPSELHVAGGVIRVWGRLSSHAAVGTTKEVVSTQVSVVLDNLDLDQIVRTGKPDADPMPGRVNGRLTMIGSTRPLRDTTLVETDEVPAFLERLSKSVSMQGKVELSQAGLGKLDAFAALYDAMSLFQDMNTPTGAGSADVRMEDGALYMNNLRYFNRGTEIRAMATVGDVWRMPKSPVSGTAVGNARPFAEAKLPLFSTFDRILTQIQPTGVAIRGTVEDPKIRPTAFDDVGSAMKAFVLGDAKAAAGKK